jgi:hypothetical protein
MKKLFLSGVIALSIVLMLSSSVTLQAAEPTTYLLLYQSNEYNSKLGDSVNYFFQKVLKPQDGLTLFTPVRAYNFSQKTRQATPLKKLIDRTRSVLKKDVSINSAGFRSIEESMVQIVTQLAEFMGTSSGGGGMSSPSGSGNEIKSLLTQYSQVVASYRNQRKIGEGLFIQIAQKLKQQPGRKYFYLIYEKTFRIVPDRDTMDALRANPNFAFLASEAFVQESTKQLMDAEKVIAALKDAGVILNFVYVKKSSRRRQGMEFIELSGDMYNVLSKIAKGSGGIVMATTKPAAAMKKAAFGK